jgi:hypothetical protein
MKKCSKCGNEHPIEFFSWKSKKDNRRSPTCKSCARMYGVAYYANNAIIMKQNARRSNCRRIADNQQLYYDYLLKHPCVCGESDPVTLDPDHNYDKVDNVSVMIRGGWAWETILIELGKCTIRCANCHRKRTARQQNWKKLSLQQCRVIDDPALDGEDLNIAVKPSS